MNKQNITYIALLRGINVGGNNVIKMSDLKSSFENMGFIDIKTYIQSGNVIFKAPQQDVELLTDRIQTTLSKEYSYVCRMVTITAAQLKRVVMSAPAGFGQNPLTHRYDVIFLKKPLTAQEAIKTIQIKEGVDEVVAGTDVLYFSRLTAKATQSKLAKIVAMPIYQNMTIRNWNTTTKLLSLVELSVK